jgi:uncharacterized protein (DUF433 family)
MQLEDYFDFLAEDDIRVKGTRVGIETILYDFIHRQHSPEKIIQTYPALTSEQVYATILYYLHNREEVTYYLADWLKWCREVRREQQLHPSALRTSLLKAKEERLAQKKPA